MPIVTKTAPTGRKSRNPMWNDDEARSATSTLVDVPMSVIEPPRMAAKLSGMRSRDGAKPELGYLVPRQDSSGQFKTPTLRDVARTAPYTHTGQFKTLRDILRFYSTREDIPRTHGERGVIRRLDLTESQLDDLEAFLKSLNGRPLPNDLLVAPGSPG